MNGESEALSRLLTAAAVRNRAYEMLDLALQGGIEDWTVDVSRLDVAAELTARVTREAYPDLAIPFHARWRHFVAGEPRLPEGDPAARARAAFDLVILSVLLDAGAGPGWSFSDPVSGKIFTRSEGLAVASQRLVESGALGTGGGALATLDGAILAQGFQVRIQSPRGLEAEPPSSGSWARKCGSPTCSRPGRASAVRALRRARRPSPGERLPRPRILELLREALGPIWRPACLHGVAARHCWRIPPSAGTIRPTGSCRSTNCRSGSLIR